MKIVVFLSWIIPTYNEEKRIEKTLWQVDSYLRFKNFSGGYEILVVDSSSKDRTREIVKKLSSQIANLKLLVLENRGKGWAVKKGMLVSRGKIRLFSDADNSTAPEYFDKMLPFFSQGYDLVISSRDSKDASGASRDVKEPWYREILGRLGNLFIQALGVWGVWDTQNGFKAFDSKAAEDIFSRSRVGGFAFDIEVLALARSLGYRFGIIPVRWIFHPQSTVTLGAYLQVLLDVFRIRWNLIIGKYST